MCIAIIIPYGAVHPSTEVLASCFKRNPDGAGLAWSYRDNHDKVYYTKGLMSFKAFLEEYDRVRYLSGVGTVVIHFRLASIGGMGPQFCHPFPLSKSFSDMYQLGGSSTTGVLVHNGTVHHMGIPSGMSDSQHLARKLAQGREVYHDDLGHSRVAVLRPDGGYTLAGRWVPQRFGGADASTPACLLSNTGYRIPLETAWYKVARWYRGLRAKSEALKQKPNVKDTDRLVLVNTKGHHVPLHVLPHGETGGFYVDPDRRVYLLVARTPVDPGQDVVFEHAYYIGTLALYLSATPHEPVGHQRGAPADPLVHL